MIVWRHLWRVMKTSTAKTLLTGSNQNMLLNISKNRQPQLSRLGYPRHFSCAATENLAGTQETPFQHILDHTDSLQNNINARQMENDVSSLVSQIKHLNELEEQKLYLESQKRENAHLMKLIVKSKNAQDFQVEKQKLAKRGQEIRRLLKQLMGEDYRVAYSKVVKAVLDLPTDLHSSTPTESQVILEIGSKKDYSADVMNHMALAKSRNVLHIRPVNPYGYYMSGDLAVLEQKIINYISDQLRWNGLQQLAGPDMVKSLIAEGCGVKEHQIHILENRNVPEDEDAKSQCLVLPGVSCLVFSAYLSSLTIKESLLPLKFFSVGCGYAPEVKTIKTLGLYGASQATKADVFGACRNLQEADVVFNGLLRMIEEVYKSLDLPTKFVLVSAKELEPMEAKRVDILIWSEGFNDFMKSGELRLCNDYISRRLHMKYSSDSTDKFMYTVHGVVLKVPSILACILERYQTTDLSAIKCHLPCLS